ncbi:hypothetical protein SAMD00019534_072540 [Acytostelium subglobosum LB1]|uniref:hypothetical protein n=1 Tax=Acytostelium subglobosum LB1 TaxID=1410327 RepID=UPI000644E563|nr:hypothetical protein SAMD00019534_072540 [Acytostelium subglobosum LB1]GAM24079.1 hypothetical protein SAMD00019534_072540 [Acytostelium subglobosum LB1]|eukprot:XP_012753115.1 hypothetical protein SAMD00019534_072540 [Acytostelium subglobosum LB1]
MSEPMSDSNYAEITIALNNEQFIPVPVDLNGTVEQLQKVIEFETNILVKDQILIHEGKEMVGSKKIAEYNVKNGDLLFMTKRPPPQQQQVQRQPQQQQQQQRPRQQQAAAPKWGNAREFINHFKNNPEELDAIFNQNQQLANAILEEDEPTIKSFLEQMEKQRKMVEAANDPFNEEGQKLIYEAIQQQNIEHNMEHAIEYTPEAFARVIMLYIDCSINEHPIKAFVDTGAQQSIMTLKCAERCGLSRLIDRRFHGIAKGVGTAKIVGRVHAAKLRLGKSHITISLSILDSPGQDTEFIFGLDQLKRHTAMVNLKNNVLEIGDEHVPFLAEKDLTEILNKEDPLPENYVPPPAGAAANPPTTTTTTSPTQTNAAPAPVASNKPAATVVAQPKPAAQSTGHSEEKINALMSLGATKVQAENLLNRCGGDVERAGALFFSTM